MQATKIIAFERWPWTPSVIFFDEWAERRTEIRSSAECLKFLKTNWHFHGSIKLFYAVAKACVDATEGVGSHALAREAFVRALEDADVRIIRA